MQADASQSGVRPSSRDFPYYEGRPVALSPLRWLVVAAGCVAGFAALTVLPSVAEGPVGRWGGVGLFVGLPLLGLALAAGRHWTAIFPPLRSRDILIGLAFGPLTLATSALFTLAVFKVDALAANPVAELLRNLEGRELALFLASTLPQLLGEELITLLPFLAILALARSGLKAPRLVAILAAWLLTALIFGALHLPTYDWRIAQTLGIISVARLVLTVPFLLTKSVWSSAIAHVTNDWLIFGFVLLAAHAA